MTRKFYIVYHMDKHISAVLQRLIDRVDEWSAKYQGNLPEKIG